MLNDFSDLSNTPVDRNNDRPGVFRRWSDAAISMTTDNGVVVGFIKIVESLILLIICICLFSQIMTIEIIRHSIHDLSAKVDVLAEKPPLRLEMSGPFNFQNPPPKPPLTSP